MVRVVPCNSRSTPARLLLIMKDSDLVEKHETLLTKKQSKRTMVRDAALGSLLAGLMVPFSIGLVRSLDQTGLSVYSPADWRYMAGRSFFDNTWLTWLTDYMLVALMAWCGSRMLSAELITGSSSSSHGTEGTKHSIEDLSVLRSLLRRFSFAGALMFLLYGASVLFGGIAHHTQRSLDQRNSGMFRALWILCVGTVSAASGAQGYLGVILRRLHELLSSCGGGKYCDEKTLDRQLWARRITSFDSPVFWMAYAATMTLCVASGAFSFQRPAADIFAVGVTQFPGTVYLAVSAWLGLGEMILQEEEKRKKLSSNTALQRLKEQVRAVWSRPEFRGSLGTIAFFFVLNSPLIVLYPLLVWTGWPLGVVNLLLHTWLAVAWTGQYVGLEKARQMMLALGSEKRDAELGASVVRASVTTMGSTGSAASMGAAS